MTSSVRFPTGGTLVVRRVRRTRCTNTSQPADGLVSCRLSPIPTATVQHRSQSRCLSVDIVDELFIVATPCQRADRWSATPPGGSVWLPGVRLSSYDDRGPLGVRWTVSGALTGTAEVWLEEHGDGTIVHAYLRADPATTDARRAALAGAGWRPATCCR